MYIKTSPPSCFDIKEPNVTKGGTLVKRCGLRLEEVCRHYPNPKPKPKPKPNPNPNQVYRYKYMLYVGSNSYANKLKYLFRCGSVVIWVRKDPPPHPRAPRTPAPPHPPHPCTPAPLHPRAHRAARPV